MRTTVPTGSDSQARAAAKGAIFPVFVKALVALAAQPPTEGTGQC